jgi:hypothetical protein
VLLFVPLSEFPLAALFVPELVALLSALFAPPGVDEALEAALAPSLALLVEAVSALASDLVEELELLELGDEPAEFLRA